MIEFPSTQYVSMMRDRDYESIIALRREHEDQLLSGRQSYEFRHLSIALLRAGKITDAIDHYQRLIDATPEEMRNDFDYCELGAARWVLGDVERAVEDWWQALACNYGDGAGNMTPALLLYFSAIRLADDELRDQAVSEIEAKLKTGWAKNWPAHLGRYLVSEASEDQVMTELQKEHPLRQPDQHCRFDFYRGVRCLERSNDEDAKICFRSAVHRPQQKTNTTEFVLARHESDNNTQR